LNLIANIEEEDHGTDHTTTSTSSYSDYTDTRLLDGQEHNLGAESKGRGNSTFE